MKVCIQYRDSFKTELTKTVLKNHLNSTHQCFLIEIICRSAADRYKLNVIDKSTNPTTGLVEDNELVRGWMEDVLGDGDYNVRGALDIIEDMIDGTDGIFENPTVYELANEHNLCTIDIYEFLNTVIMKGTTMVFIALEMRGDGVHQLDKQQLEKRLILNRKKYNEGCPYYTPSDTQLKFDGIWGDWGDMRICPKGGYATSFSQRVEEYIWNFGLFDNTALNSICLQCSAGGQVCSQLGYWGSWKWSPTCQEGFIGADLKFEERQGDGDDTAANDFSLASSNHGYWKYAGNGERWGEWEGQQFCPEEERICGLQTRVEEALGGGDADDTALNGVYIQCCEYTDIQ